MTLQQLRYFLAVVENGSLSKAAETMFVSQPSLTAAIRKLEEEYHITFFRRTKTDL